MTNLTEIEQAGPLSAHYIGLHCEARFPAAYSHGGFAQLRPTEAAVELNPLAPIQVPVGFNPDPIDAFGGSAVMFLRS